MTRHTFTTGQRVRLPSGGTGTVIAPADAAGLVLVRIGDRSLVPVPSEQLRRENMDELAARAALRPRTGRVLNLGPVRPSVTSGSPRVALAGTEAERGTDAAPLTPRAPSTGPGRATGEPGLGGALAQRAGLTEGRDAA